MLPGGRSEGISFDSALGRMEIIFCEAARK